MAYVIQRLRNFNLVGQPMPGKFTTDGPKGPTDVDGFFQMGIYRETVDGCTLDDNLVGTMSTVFYTENNDAAKAYLPSPPFNCVHAV